LKNFNSLFLLLFIVSCADPVKYKFSTEDINKSMIRHSDVQQKKSSVSTSLKGSSIKLISWNYLAGCRQNLRKWVVMTFCSIERADTAFKYFVQGQDLILIQEAYLDQQSIQVLKDMGQEYSWDMAISYITDKITEIPPAF
jgi:hypothetical protein